MRIPSSVMRTLPKIALSSPPELPGAGVISVNTRIDNPPMPRDSSVQRMAHRMARPIRVARVEPLKATRLAMRRRRIANLVAFSGSTLATLIGLAILCAILWTLLSRGIGGLSMRVFTEMTPAPGSSGGLLNAIFGSVLMTLLGILIGAPIGLLAGTYLAEYGRSSRLSTVVRFINDVQLSAPSIIIGMFVYTVVVARMGHFSGLAGAIALSIIALPVMVRTTEDMLNLVPKSMRDGSAGLGAQPWRTITHIVYPAARN